MSSPMSGGFNRQGAGLRAGLTLEYPMSLGIYTDYRDAQRAVDYLSDNEFPVENCMIVGTELKQIERVVGRLTWGRVLAGGALSGAWFGVFIGLILSMFESVNVLGVVVSTVIWGTAGLVGSLIGGAIAIGSSLATLLLMRKTAALDPMFVMVAALGGFMGKLIVLLLAVILLRNQPWLEPKALGITLVATVLVTSFLEARASKRSRSQMVVPASEGT